MKGVLIGLDVGTSSVKAAMFDLRGYLMAKAAVPIRLYSPAPGWFEQEPDEWWRAAVQILQEIIQNTRQAQVLALGLSGQCPSHVLVTHDHHPIGRAIIWRDQRAAAEAAWLAEHVTHSQAKEWLGTSSLGDATCPPARLLWLQRHALAEWDQAAAVIQPKDFIALRLTGRIATDRYSAYCLGNPDTGQYDSHYFEVLGIPIEKMPEMLKPVEVIGSVTPAVEQEIGLKAGTPVIIGTIDAYCDNLACGITHPGRAVDVAGTSEIVSLAIDQKVDAPGVFPLSLSGDATFLCGPTQAGGDTLRWLYHCFYTDSGEVVQYEMMEAAAKSVPAGSEGLVFLPYLSGERAPLWDADARGAFIGLTFQHDRRHCSRAVYESIGFAIRHILEISEGAAGQKAGELIVCGSGSRSAFWNQIKADILQRPVIPTVVSETGCLGAAMLASVGIGLYQDLKAACSSMVVFRDRLIPDVRLAEVYEQGYRAYRSFYPALKPILSISKDRQECTSVTISN
ncbi:MAG: FGGY family carbohydrate kinase [Anaerolineaceae bacterium]|jgi:xylulokinase